MKFYSSIESLRHNPPAYGDPFILQWEIPNPKDDQTRKYVVFDGIKEYWKYFSCNRYTTCHEVFIAASYNHDDEVIGHPAFDIDLKLTHLPSTWQQDLEEDILSVLSMQYPAIDIKMENEPYVWMTSTNPTKISKHLTIRNITFSMWRAQMKLLVSGLKELSDRKSIDLVIEAIDDAILRKKGSLRLPLNSKKPVEEVYYEDGIMCTRLHTYPLNIDSKNHTFLDGIVLIHDDNMYTVQNGFMLTPADLAPEYQDRYTITSVNHVTDYREDVAVDENELINAFNIIDKRYSTGLQAGTVSGSFLNLLRQQPGKCPISGKVHDSDNGYVFKKGNRIFYGCHRGCKLELPGKTTKTMDITPYTGKSYEDNAMTILSMIDRNKE